MIQFIVGGVVGTVGAVAASGAGYRMATGVVRGVGRLLEGDPKQALGEVVSGVLDPLAIAGSQLSGLVLNTMDVSVYGAVRLGSLMSEDAARIIASAGGFGDFVPKLVAGAVTDAMLANAAAGMAATQAEHEARVNGAAARAAAAA